MTKCLRFKKYFGYKLNLKDMPAIRSYCENFDAIQYKQEMLKLSKHLQETFIKRKK